MAVLKTFLCCFKLRTGCLFIGYCGTISSVLCMILAAVAIIFTAVNENSLTGDGKTVNEIFMGVAIFIFIVFAMIFALHVVLLKGVYEKKPQLLNIYLIIMTTYLVIMVIGVISAIVQMQIYEFGLPFILNFAGSIYNLLVIKSHREEIENATDDPPAYSKP